MSDKIDANEGRNESQPWPQTMLANSGTVWTAAEQLVSLMREVQAALMSGNTRAAAEAWQQAIRVESRVNRILNNTIREVQTTRAAT